MQLNLEGEHMDFFQQHSLVANETQKDLFVVEGRYTRTFRQCPALYAKRIEHVIVILAKYDMLLLTRVMESAYLTRDKYSSLNHGVFGIIPIGFLCLAAATKGIVSIQDIRFVYPLHDFFKLVPSRIMDISIVLDEFKTEYPQVYTALLPVFNLKDEKGKIPADYLQLVPNWTPNTHYLLCANTKAQVETIVTLMYTDGTVWSQIPFELTQQIVNLLNKV